MSMSKGKMSQLRTAFKSVHGAPASDEQELIRYGNEIIFHAEKFPFEDDDLMSFRFSTISELSETDAIMEYLAKVPEEEFSGSQMSTYGKLFELGKKYGIGGQESSGDSDSKPQSSPKAESKPEDKVEDLKEEQEEVSNRNSKEGQSEGYNSEMESDGTVAHQTNSAASSNDTTGASETINATNTHIEEEKRMDAIQKLAEEAGQVGVGSNVGTNVAEVSKNDKLAAKKVVESTQMDRINYSKNAKIEKVLITAIDREKKAVNGRASMGHVSNPRKAFETFVSKTGCTVEDGVVKFSKLHSSQLHDDALKMYNLLKAAMENPETEVEPYFGKEGAAVPVSIKGIVIDDPSKQEITLAQKDIAAHILQNAFLYLNVDSKSNAQFQLDAATSRAGSAPKKSYVVRVANKAELLEDESVVVYVKRIIEKVSESRTGFKSALSVSCNSSKPDAQGNPKKVTWRIPLEVEQYEVEIVDKYSDLFKSGVGNVVKPISASSEADITNIVDKITNMIAAEAAKSSSESIVGASMLAQVNEARSELVTADAAAVNETLGGGPAGDSSDFEG